MDGLRWLLFLFGVLVVAGVYIYSRRQQSAGVEAPDSGDRREPTLGDDDVDVEIDIDVRDAEPVADVTVGEDTDDSDDDDQSPGSEGEESGQVPRKIVTLRLVAKDRGAFAGDELILSLRGIGMRHGRFGIYHRIDGEDEDRTIFSAASLVEPGSFDLDHIREQSIPGISLFMVLPNPIDGVVAFDMMMEAARTLAQSLDGELLDESGSTLSIQRERYMREEIVHVTHVHQIAE